MVYSDVYLIFQATLICVAVEYDQIINVPVSFVFDNSEVETIWGNTTCSNLQPGISVTISLFLVNVDEAAAVETAKTSNA